MATLNLQVEANEDDGLSYENYGIWSNSEDWIAAGATGTGAQYLYARFTGVSGLAGATIDAAHIDLYDWASFGNPLTKIRAEDAAAPIRITGGANHQGRARTTAGEDWDGDLDPGWEESPSIISVIQELATDYDPTVIQILDDDDGSFQGSTNRHLVRSHDFNNALAPKLDIDYTPAGIGADEMMAAISGGGGGGGGGSGDIMAHNRKPPESIAY